MDSKGRIVIPEEVRKELRLSEGTKIRLKVEGEGDSSILVVKKSTEPQAFVRRTEGTLKKGSAVKAADPLRLKEIWAGI